MLAGILATQHGDARAHGKEGFRHCVRADRSAGLLGAGAADTETKDEDVAETGLKVRDVTEGWLMTEGCAVRDPRLEGGETGSSSFGDKRGVCGLQRSAEIRVEAIAGRRVCCRHGRACG